MLVLSRKVGAKIVIASGKIELVVLEIKGNKVRLGISAPKDITILRSEAASTAEGQTTS